MSYKSPPGPVVRAREEDMHLRARKDRAGHSIRPASLLAAFVATGTMVAACGGSPSASVANLGSSTTTTTLATNNGSSQSGDRAAGNSGFEVGIGGVTVQYAQCMRAHGVPNFPDPNGQGQVQMSGVDPRSASFQAAQRACAKYSPGGGKPPSPAQQAEALAHALKFSQCMRSHGLTDYPDPQSVAGGIRISIRAGQGSNLDPNNPQFQAAQKACRSLLPFGKGRANTGGTKG